MAALLLALPAAGLLLLLPLRRRVVMLLAITRHEGSVAETGS
jgi:hypothetical protein